MPNRSARPAVEGSQEPSTAMNLVRLPALASLASAASRLRDPLFGGVAAQSVNTILDGAQLLNTVATQQRADLDHRASHRGTQRQGHTDGPGKSLLRFAT
jgi:hypothetical protein